MPKKKIMVWETLTTVSGGQKMTLTVMDMLKDEYEFICLIPEKGLLSQELDKRGIKYILMGNQSLPAGIKGRSVIPKYAWMSAKNILKSLGAIIKFKPDVLYAPGPAALPWSAVCGSLTGKPVVWHLHHIFLDGATRKLLNICSQWKAVKKIIAVSECVGKQISNEKAHGKIDVLYNPVNIKKYSAGDAEKIFEEFGSLRGKQLIIGHVALIQKTKKQDFVLSVIAELRKMGYNVFGLFAGECREPDYMETLNEYIADSNLGDNVCFLGRRNDIPDLLKAMDLLMIPSTFEGFPLAGLEAAAAGLSVAACDEAGAEEFIRVSGDGNTFDDNNVYQAVQAVEDIIKNHSRYSAAGKEFAESCSEDLYKTKLKIIISEI